MELLYYFGDTWDISKRYIRNYFLNNCSYREEKGCRTIIFILS